VRMACLSIGVSTISFASIAYSPYRQDSSAVFRG
jgi:hypothetical protein